MSNTITLQQLAQTFPAYYSWRRIEDCGMDSEMLEYFPTRCSCGSEMIISVPEFTQVQCEDPYCWVKQGYSLSYFISKLGFQGIGDETCLSLVKAQRDKFKYTSFLCAFMLDDSDILSTIGDHYGSIFISIRDQLKSTPWKMNKIVAALGIPGLGARSKIFNIISTPQQFIDIILNNRISELLLTIGSSDDMLYAQLELHKVDILLLYHYIAPLAAVEAGSKIYVAITGSVSVDGIGYSRTDFIHLCQSIKDSEGNQIYELVETKAKSKVEYVIADAPSNSSKYQMGVELGKLITAQTFYHMLLDSVTKAQDEETEEAQ